MQIETVRESYYDAVFDTDRMAALELIEHARQEGVAPEALVFDVVLPTMEKMIIALTDNDEATLSQHFTASKLAVEVVDMLLPHFREIPRGSGTLVIGTARGDFHGLGKKIVGGYLRANLYTVHDLGMNVSPEKFVDEAVRLNADAIGVSSMMMHTATGPEGPLGVRRVLDERGLSQRIKLLVGGAPYWFDDELYKEVKADGWAKNAFEAIGLLRHLLPHEVHHA